MGKYLTWLNKKCHKNWEFTLHTISRSQARDIGTKKLGEKLTRNTRTMGVKILFNFVILLEIFLIGNASENCGGTFTGFQYPVTSPNYPNDYPPDQDCIYILKGSQSAKCEQEFHLQFLDFQLEASKACAKDYVKVGNESIYCGNSIGIRKFKSQDKSLKVLFHSDSNTTAKGFRILVTTLSCPDTELEPKQNNSLATPKADIVGDEKSVINSYPKLKFAVEDEVESPFRLKIRPSSPRSPSENLELPEFEQHHFHDEYCGHVYSVNDDGIGSITSYLYLPPAQISRPPQMVGVKKTPSNLGPSIFSHVIPSEVVIRDSDEDLQITEPPADLILPSRKIPPTFTSQVFPKSRETFQPLKRPQSYSQFYDPTKRWVIYGTPNYSPPGNPSIPNNNFDPFANDDKNHPGAGNNPVTSNCGGNNGNPNYNPSENFSPGSNVDVNYPNFGNGYSNFDESFGVNGNYFPNNNFYNPIDTTYYNTGLSQCCGTVYSSSSFTLASPGFPALIYSSSNYECQYTIRRSSENICGLELYLKFFNFGSDDQFCAYGYIEIDGSRVCGCKTGANITSYFDNIATKTITVKYLGYPKNKFSGFVIEVTQVACSTSYLRFGNEQDPIFIRNYNPRGKRNAEYLAQRVENLPVLKTSQNLLLNTCRIFKFVNWIKAAKQVYLKSAQCSTTVTGTTGVSSAISIIPIFPENGNSALINYPLSSNCETVNVVDGTITSPNYPSAYNNDLNLCYRFYKAPGYCQLELAMLDFDLETSTFCRKDYVSFSGQKRRYCGTSLAGTRTIFDMTQATFADLYFATDSAGTGRGFRVGFTQILC